MKNVLLMIALVGCGVEHSDVIELNIPTTDSNSTGKVDPIVSVYELPSGGGDSAPKCKVVKIVKIKRPDAGRIRINLGDVLREYEAKPNSDPIVEKAIRFQLALAGAEPTGELTKADLEKVTRLNLDNNKLTDVKGLEKFAELTFLNLMNNPDLTKAQIAELHNPPHRQEVK